jgi:ankyrin repeat protein
MKQVIAAGADVDGRAYANGSRPLCVATFTNDLTAAKLLLDAKADVTSEGFNFSFTAAVVCGKAEMTKLYISAGADLNARSQTNETYLHQLVGSCLPDGKWTNNELVSEKMPIINERTNRVPIEYPAVFKVLVDAKADITARGPKGKTPLAVAAHANNGEAVNALLAAGADVNDLDVGMTPLMAAALDGGLSAASALIAAGADVSHVNANGRTALTLAVMKNRVDVATAVIDAGADVNYIHALTGVSVLDMAMLQDVDGVTRMSVVLKQAGGKSVTQLQTVEPSEWAHVVASGDMKRVNKLVGSVSQKEKNAALAVATIKNRCPMVKCLLAAGANPATTYLATTVLTWASIEGYTDIVRELVDAGADITVKDQVGKTALQHATKLKHCDIVAILLAKEKEVKKANTRV